MQSSPCYSFNCLELHRVFAFCCHNHCKHKELAQEGLIDTAALLKVLLHYVGLCDRQACKQNPGVHPIAGHALSWAAAACKCFKPRELLHTSLKSVTQITQLVKIDMLHLNHATR